MHFCQNAFVHVLDYVFWSVEAISGVFIAIFCCLHSAHHCFHCVFCNMQISLISCRGGEKGRARERGREGKIEGEE